MKNSLFVRPSHDDVTAYLYHYSKKLVEKSELKGFNTINKEKENANKTVISVIEKSKPTFIMFNGHGSPVSICGHNDEVIIKLNNNHNLLKNSQIIYSLSCSSAAKLGQKVADDKTAFVGYVDDFALGMDVNCQASIQRDKRAKLFLEPSNLLVESLLKGNSAIQAVEKAKKLMKENILKLRTDPFPDAKDYIPYLFNNYLILEVLGNNKIKVK